MNTTATAQPESYWKVADVARFLAMSPQWVYKHAELGTIPCTRLSGGALRFKPDAIRAYAESCSSGGKTKSKVLPFHPAR